MKYSVTVILPCDHGNQPGCSVGHRVMETRSLQKALDYADQHYMLTGMAYDVWCDDDCYDVAYTGQHNPKFLEK